MGVELEGCVLREAQVHGAGAGAHGPCAGWVAIGTNISASGMSFERAANIAQFDSAGTGLSSYRALRCLFQRDVTAACLAVKTTSYASCANGSAARSRIDAAFCV